MTNPAPGPRPPSLRTPSLRAQIVARRTYLRPRLDTANSRFRFETWDEMIDRVISHQRRLWLRALDDVPAAQRTPRDAVEDELARLRVILHSRRAALAGRTHWLGGTPKAFECECSQLNCSFIDVRTVYDLVDTAWLLLNGSGVGFRVVPGGLFSFPSRIPEITVIPSERESTYRGDPRNYETYSGGVWTIAIGDSAEAWAKALGKLVSGSHYGCRELVLDFTRVRGPGGRLRGYGWICHGHQPLADAMLAIAEIRNSHTGPLPAQAVHSILNHIGTILSTRRSAQLALCDADRPWADEFRRFKNDLADNPHKAQSNNTLNFTRQPSLRELTDIIAEMMRGGMGEPGIRNHAAALSRAPWSAGTNPCGEILLPSNGFCNLVEVCLPAHLRDGILDQTLLAETVHLIARANYRQTCMKLDRDPILQRTWHENNHNLRLCGVGLTGIAQTNPPGGAVRELRTVAGEAALGMSRELHCPPPALVTTVKPSGTMSKVMDCTEGIHSPLGRYVLNRISVLGDDPLVLMLDEMGVPTVPHPLSDNSVLVELPVDFGPNIPARPPSFMQQFLRYLDYMRNWADHNVSCTLYYDDHDTPGEIASLIHANWDNIVSISMLPRTPTEGYAYYPQEAISADEYRERAAALAGKCLPEFAGGSSTYTHTSDDELDACEGGACPVR